MRNQNSNASSNQAAAAAAFRTASILDERSLEPVASRRRTVTELAWRVFVAMAPGSSDARRGEVS